MVIAGNQARSYEVMPDTQTLTKTSPTHDCNANQKDVPVIPPLLPPKIVLIDEGPTYQVLDDIVRFKTVAADTNGAYAMFEIQTPPSKGTPPHRQRYDDEAFWVLEGTYTFLLGSQQVTLNEGGYVFAPRGTVHAYTNSGESAARMLVLLTPGGIHERFFAEVGAQLNNRQGPPRLPTSARLSKIARTYGIEILEPGEADYERT